MIKGKLYKAHRLPWFYVYGTRPERHHDHINIDKLDNRVSNLRLAIDSQNKMNKAPARNNSRGYRGGLSERCQFLS